jgi:hypothetical protein
VSGTIASNRLTVSVLPPMNTSKLFNTSTRMPSMRTLDRAGAASVVQVFASTRCRRKYPITATGVST